MKRPNQDVAGRPKVLDGRPDVAGSRIALDAADVASSRRARHGPMSSAADDAMLLEDFTDFLIGNEGFEMRGLPAPDPGFRERLRRRLWKNYVVSHLRKGGREIH